MRLRNKKSEWLKRSIKVLGINMSIQRFLVVVVFVCIVYILIFELSEKHSCLLVDHKYGYSIEYPSNRVVHVFGELGNHNHIDQKARFYPRTLPFLQTSVINIYWTDELKNTADAIRSWGEEQLRNDWLFTSRLESVTIGQANYEAWTATFRRDSWQNQHYYIPRKNGAFLIEFTQLGSSDDLDFIESQMLDSFLISDTFITDDATAFQQRTIDCIH